MSDPLKSDVRHAPRPMGHSLPSDGRCCGRKPLFYKRDYRTNAPRPHHFCTRCDAEYDEGGTQTPNWQWAEMDGRLYHTRTVKDAALDMLAALKDVLVDEAPDCSRVQHGECTTRRCAMAGGYSGRGGYDPNISTCAIWRAEKAIAKAEGRE